MIITIAILDFLPRASTPGLPGPALRVRRAAEAPEIRKAVGLVAQVLVNSLDLRHIFVDWRIIPLR